LLNQSYGEYGELLSCYTDDFGYEISQEDSSYLKPISKANLLRSPIIDLVKEDRNSKRQKIQNFLSTKTSSISLIFQRSIWRRIV